MSRDRLDSALHPCRLLHDRGNDAFDAHGLPAWRKRVSHRAYVIVAVARRARINDASAPDCDMPPVRRARHETRAGARRGTPESHKTRKIRGRSVQ